VVALDVVVLVEDAAQMTLAEWDDVAEALLAYRAHESFRIGVQIRTARRQAHELHVRVGDHALELRRVERVAVDDQAADAAKGTGHGVREISRHLRHPGAVGRGRDSGDVHAPGLEVDDEEDQVAHQAPLTVSTSPLKKSAAAMAPQCALRNVFHDIVLPRRGAGSMPLAPSAPSPTGTGSWRP
jgi:hypothetical protein